MVPVTTLQPPITSNNNSIFNPFINERGFIYLDISKMSFTF